MLGLMNPRLTKLAAIASTVVLALGVTACGSGDDQAQDAAPKKAAAASATPSSPATTSPADDAPVDATQAAFFQSITDAQVEARSSHVEMTIDGAGTAITAQGDVAVGRTPADTVMSMTMDTGATGMGTVSMILVDKVLYVNAGGLTGDKYGAIDLDSSSSMIAQQFGSITEQLDPSQQLEQFQKALTSLEKKGKPETIDGVEAQPYELTIDPSKMVDLGAGGAAVPKTLTYTLYIGPDDLLRRITASVAGSTVRADYSRWGEKVDVEAPPADQISQDALGQLGGS